MNRAELNTKMSEIAQYRLLKKEAEAELDRLENELKAYMEANQLEDLIGDEHKATYKAFTQSRFDSKAFQKDHADMYESYKKPSTTMRFTFA